MGNNLVYRTHDPVKIAAGVEEIVRRDVGWKTPLTVRTTMGTTDPLTARSFFADVGRLMVEHKTQVLMTLEIDLPGPRESSLIVPIHRQGVIASPGSVIFVMDLARPIDEPVGFEEHRMFKRAAFLGGRAAARLNAAEGLTKLADDTLASLAVVGSLTLQLPRVFALTPSETGSRLMMRSLPHKSSILGPMTTGAGDMLRIAKLVENAL